MANIPLKEGKIKRKLYAVIKDGEEVKYQQQILETSADMTTVEDTDNKFGGATNVQDALTNLATGVASAGKVDDVQDGSGKSLVTNKIAKVTPAGIGAEAAFTKNTAFNKNFETSAANIKANGTAAVGISSNVARADHVHPTDTTRASATDLTNHIDNKENPHGVTKAQVGLGNVDNTADADKHVKQADQDGAGNNIVNTYATKTALQEGLAGKSKTVTFDTYRAFVIAVDAYTKTQLNIGDNVLIKTLGVPDMWVTRVDSVSTQYIYTTDQEIVDTLGTTTGLQVGYFNFSKLETTKVDLDPYQTKTDNSLTTTAKTVVGAINENKGEIDKIKTGTTKVKSAETADNATKLNNQAADYYTNYTNATNKPILDTTATEGQATSATEEISGTIKLHKVSKTGNYTHLLDTPVTVVPSGPPTSQAGAGLSYFGNGASDAPTALRSNPFLLHTIKPTSGATYQAILNGNSVYTRIQSQNVWSDWVEYDLSTFAKKSDIPEVSVSTSGSGFVSAVTVDATNKHKLNVTKQAITNSDLPDSGANPTANVAYTAVAVNSKGIVTSVANAVEFGTTTNNSPSSKLVVGGIFFELVT